MISINPDDINSLLCLIIWPMARILGLFNSAPIFSDRAIPLRIRVAMGIVLSVVTVPLLPPEMKILPSSEYSMLLALISETLIGFILGLFIRLILAAVELAGEFIGLQMGLGFATIYNLGQNNMQPVISDLYGVLAILIMLSLNGHILMINAVAESFSILPVVTSVRFDDVVHHLLMYGQRVFYMGLLMALPIIVGLSIINLSLGILSRTAPQMNLFSLGFPVTILCGFFLMMVSLPLAGQLMSNAFDRTLQGTRALLEPSPTLTHTKQ